MRTSIVRSWLLLGRRRWRVGTVLFVLISTLGAGVVLGSRAIYRADAKLRLGDPPPMTGVSPGGGMLGLLRMGGDPFANDMELLGSRTLAENVVDDVALHVKLHAPRGWHRDSLFARVSATRATRRASYRVEWLDDGVTITAPNGAVVRGQPGQEIRFGAARVVARPWREGMPREVRLVTIPHGEAVRSLSSRLRIERARRDANVLRLRYQDSDPAITAAVVQAAVGRFVALRTQIMRRETGETVDSLRGVALRTRAELARAEHEVETQQSTSGLIAPEAQAKVGVEQQAEVIERLERARMELRALSAALDRSTAADNVASSWATLLAYPRFLASATISDLITSLSQLEQRRRELARRRQPENTELRAVLDQLEHLDRSLRTVAIDFRTTLQAEIKGLEAESRLMRSQLATVPAQTIELGRRQRDLRVLSEMLVLTEQRLRQEEMRQAMTFANVQIIDPPALRERPIWPRRKLGPAVAILLAAGTALLGMLIVDRADLTARNAAQIRATIGAPVLATFVRGRTPAISREDAQAIAQRTPGNGTDAAHIAIGDVDDGTLAQLVAEGIRESVPVCVQAVTAVRDYSSAVNAAAGGPVVLAVEIGRTRLDALFRATTLLAEADAVLVGAVMICTRADALDTWA
jgi:uncharacterized protein involved in exopolysaccharide biosynthesis